MIKQNEWETEPDQDQWLDKETGLPCLILRNGIGALCGYVGISSDHPFYLFHYDNISIEEHPHGGLTFSGYWPEVKFKSFSRDTKGFLQPIWWIGFDCAHAGDLYPKGFHQESTDIYRNMEYVKNEIKLLARQLTEKEKDS